MFTARQTRFVRSASLFLIKYDAFNSLSTSISRFRYSFHVFSLEFSSDFRLFCCRVVIPWNSDCLFLCLFLWFLPVRGALLLLRVELCKWTNASFKLRKHCRNSQQDVHAKHSQKNVKERTVIHSSLPCLGASFDAWLCRKSCWRPSHSQGVDSGMVAPLCGCGNVFWGFPVARML